MAVRKKKKRHINPELIPKSSLLSSFSAPLSAWADLPQDTMQAIEVKVPFSITSREDAGSKLPKTEKKPEEKTSGPLTHCYLEFSLISFGN